MTPAEFKTKWAKFSGKESAAYVEHFNDLCRMLRLPTPIEADPTGDDSFCFQKRVVKDAELFEFGGVAEPVSKERGFADVWKRDYFGWEYKGPGEDLEKGYKQLLRYRESLLNPPLLIVCDFVRFIVRTNFNGAVQETHEFTNAEIDAPENIRILRAALTNPAELHPAKTAAEVTEKLAKQIAAIALSLQQRECVELADAKTRRQHYVAQKKNLRIARFLNRLVFCFFAEDTGLLPDNTFSEICQAGLRDPQLFAESLEDLFRAMANGGRFGTQKVRHFNGHLFEDATVFELTAEEIEELARASESDWQSIQPSIMGTLFERALDEGQRSQLGAHYTSEADIKTLVEPVLMAPLRREWSALRRSLAPAILKGKGTSETKATLTALQQKLASVTVLDPACGSGNFLYVALQLLLGLEKEVIAAAAHLGWSFAPVVSVQQLRAIELNPYAYELAQVSVQIGYLQWRRENGFDNERTPVLQNLDGFENKDALLNETFRKKPKNLKAAQAEEHGGQDELFKVYTERAWPACDVILGNPPFLGDKFMRRELGDGYVEELRKIYGDRIPGQSDLCCYWFEKARQQIEGGECKRAGLIATQGIRGGANREVLKRIKATGDIFFAESDRDWILGSATVHVSMVGFDGGSENERSLDGNDVATIHANLSAAADTTNVAKLSSNLGLSFLGSCKGGAFDISDAEARNLLLDGGNPHCQPNSDVVRPVCNTSDLVQSSGNRWIIDNAARELEDAARYEAPHKLVVDRVKPLRDANRDKWLKKNWWRPQRMRPEMRIKVEPLPRFLVTTTTSKYRLFRWLSTPTLPDHQLIVFARDDDYFFGVLHSRFHEIWALAQGTQLREKESGFRYTPTTCFETFPFPFTPDVESNIRENINGSVEAQLDAAKHYSHIVLREDAEESRSPLALATAIAISARELNDLREKWLNPPEWTTVCTLQFPGTVDGPWSRFVRDGIVRYPLTEARDAESAAKLKKRTLTNLYNERPAWLANAHAKLDVAVAAAYGWPADLPDDEILSRLLTLNLSRAAVENEATAKAATAKRPARGKRADEMI